MVAISSILAVASLIGGSIVSAKVHVRSQGSSPIKGAYLVEVPKDVQAEDHVKSYLASQGIHDVTIRQRISTKFFNGVSFKINSGPKDTEHELSLVSNTPRIINAFKVHRVVAPKPRIIATEGAGKFTPEGIHSLTGVNQVRNELGLTGKGIKVAVIDTGVDYNHEALGGGFGPGYKVSFGYDLVGNDYNSTSTTTTPDPDPLDTCSEESHGTHVSGIVGADARSLTKPEWISDVKFTGVAPDVTLGAYRVFGCQGDSGNDVITEAIYRAAEDGADIINLSLGGGPTYNDGADSDAASRVGAAGSFVFASNGNDGASGLMVAGSPGVAAQGFGIASFDNVEVPKFSLTFNGVKHQINLGGNNANFDYNAPYEIVANDLTADDTDQQEDGLHDINPAIKGKMALIRWGDIGFSNRRCTAAAKAGAIACILYSNSDSVPNIAGSALIPSLATTHEAGKILVAALKAASSSPITLTVSDVLSQFSLPTAGTVSDFSSPGLDQDLLIKPDFGGIGGEVYSTISTHAKESQNLKQPYAVYSGTSMSSPYTAGVAALLLQAYGRNKPTFDEFRTLLQNTANYAKKYGTDLIDSVAYQGAGLINAYQAAKAKTSVYPSRLGLNDTQYTQQHYSLTVTNKNTVPVTYTVKHQPALMVTPFKAGDDAMLNAFDQSYTADYATVKFAKNNDRVDSLDITVAAGESKSFNIHVQPPSNAIAGLFPVYSGYIVVDVEGEKVVSVPYAGVVGKWRDSPIFVRKSASYDKVLQDATNVLSQIGVTVSANATLSTGLYSFDSFLPVSENTVFQNISTAGAFISIIAATNSRLNIVEAIYKGNDWKALSDLGIKRETKLYAYVDAGASLNPNTDGSINITPGGSLVSIQQRNSYIQGQSVVKPTLYVWSGLVATNATDETTVVPLPAGTYQLRFSGLKHFGRTSAPVGGSDYETILTPTFTLA
ncbi:hypothetical protein HDU97_004439 [Phlyctochytrium planicorne]|nr:hypothetical protein HDU97_004439 [Phlyctochytrium planicorne]